MKQRVLTAAGFAVIALSLLHCGGSPNHHTITVFAAASLTEAFEDLAEAFQAQHPNVTVRLSFSGSTVLRTQVLEGAPADVFVSASPDEVATLDAAGLVIEAETFAENTLVIAVHKGASSVISFADLAKRGVRLVLAAETVPAGRYARQSLALAATNDALGSEFAAQVLANVRSNEANVRAALAKVELGEAEAAIVYTSDLESASNNVRSIAIPEQLQTPVEYRIALLSNNQFARSFIAFTTSPLGKATLQKHGFKRARGTP
ncbi:MAG: molybdate ABC transporter substrate-binding protein [Dehalococcoidia bacterium]|nr:molybdate ABC transporter substrate-binding protein [Dehalococcoidia bacterium]|tara:strand:- start:5268 stop:6053 length:786 start_codon:yes stop_codon:yes gene_type:complete